MGCIMGPTGRGAAGSSATVMTSMKKNKKTKTKQSCVHVHPIIYHIDIHVHVNY